MLKRSGANLKSSPLATIQGVWERRRYQAAHSKIPSAKESALFWTQDVVRVSYEIASTPHKITWKKNTDKLHPVMKQ